MAHATSKETLEYILRLSEEEARRLRSLVQNELWDDEDEEWRSFRKSIWKALDSAITG